MAGSNGARHSGPQQVDCKEPAEKSKVFRHPAVLRPGVPRAVTKPHSRLEFHTGPSFTSLMNSPKRRPAPPHNPGVRELVQNKRRFSSPQTRDDGQSGFRGWHERGYLPHRDQPNLTQSVTFRLADSLPTELRGEWGALLQIENERERRTQLEAYLDQGRGRCELKRTDVAGLVEGALRYFHGHRYELHAWVVMPNHVHVLFHVGEVPMSEILESWKSYTAKAANKLLQRDGQFWDEDYWDTYMRNAEHERRTIRYTEANPVKARLCPTASDWLWSSARFRDEFGKLKLPA